VRVAAGRDVYLEEMKDAAMAMYSRRVAMRVAERLGAMDDFDGLTPASARALADRFGLDVLVTERALDLPLAYRNARFSIYRLKP
jgi:protein gp37